MRILVSLFLISLIAIILPSKPALAQNPVDTTVLAEADAIMTEMQSADGWARPRLQSRLEKLGSTTGLSPPCKMVVDRMLQMALITFNPDDTAAMTEALRNTFKVGLNEYAAKLVGERKACNAAAAGQSPPD